MVIAVTLPEIFGYSVFIENGNYPSSGKLLDWEVGKADTNIWIAERIHIVVSNERYYRNRQKKSE